ncbi:beta-L-arabinofuranosidase domain-containing protein [Luteimonas sp. gir]|uniref:glycoside hydrolase family 127 protein n=1 Tax=Luteimonas sp. gir TaxID=3127960 RepID=UPI003075CE3D
MAEPLDITARDAQRPPAPDQVRLRGLLGEALDANRRGRLSHFVTGPDSPAIAIFDPAHRADNEEGDWYGEHAGKWLAAAAKAAARSGDDALEDSVRAVAAYLAQVQEDDGYLGTYAPHRRFMVPQPPKPESWNGEPALRTWDVWTHAYLLLGLLEVHRRFPEAGALETARRIGLLCWRTFCVEGLDITTVGNHHGMSATVLLDPVMDLHAATGDARFLELARRILAQADANPRLALLERALAGADPSEIATGKAYQLCWNLVGLAKLARASGDPRHRHALDAQWQAIRDHHLSLGGGPFGGIGHRSREVFNPAFVFDPHAYVETCSILAWLQLNRELLAITGQARYAEEIERTAYNDLLGAQAPDGEGWCYYSYANGRRIHTNYWRCCKSSGAMAIEELPAVAYATDDEGLVVNLLGPGEATCTLPGAGEVTVVQDTRYPFDGDIGLRLRLAQPAHFALRVRIPAWAQGATLTVAGAPWPEPVVAGDYVRIARTWTSGDAVALTLQLRPRIHRRVYRNVQESRAPDGSPVRQQVLRQDYIAFSRGPLVYATGLIDGYRTAETVRLPDDDAQIRIEELPPAGDGDAAAVGLRLHLAERAPIDFAPYYGIGERRDRIWRTTWLGLAPSDDGADAGDCGAL